VKPVENFGGADLVSEILEDDALQHFAPADLRQGRRYAGSAIKQYKPANGQFVAVGRQGISLQVQIEEPFAGQPGVKGYELGEAIVQTIG